MKKILSGLILLSLLFVLVTPMMVSAAPVDVPSEMGEKCIMRFNLTGTDWVERGFDCPAVDAPCDFSSEDFTCGSCCLMNAVYTVTNWIFLFVVAVAGMFIVWGGFVIATAGGAPEKVNTGRMYIIYAIIAVVVALLAKALPAIVAAVIHIY